MMKTGVLYGQRFSQETLPENSNSDIPKLHSLPPTAGVFRLHSAQAHFQGVSQKVIDFKYSLCCHSLEGAGAEKELAYNTDSQVTILNAYNNNKYTEFIRTDQLTNKHHHTITISPGDRYDPDTILTRPNPDPNNNVMLKANNKFVISPYVVRFRWWPLTPGAPGMTKAVGETSGWLRKLLYRPQAKMARPRDIKLPTRNVSTVVEINQDFRSATSFIKLSNCSWPVDLAYTRIMYVIKEISFRSWTMPRIMSVPFAPFFPKNGRSFDVTSCTMSISNETQLRSRWLYRILPLVRHWDLTTWNPWFPGYRLLVATPSMTVDPKVTNEPVGTGFQVPHTETEDHRITNLWTTTTLHAISSWPHTFYDWHLGSTHHMHHAGIAGPIACTCPASTESTHLAYSHAVLHTSYMHNTMSVA